MHARHTTHVSLEAITMMDMEDLLAPAALGGDDILGILDGGSLSEALASSGGLLGLGARGARGGAARQEEVRLVVCVVGWGRRGALVCSVLR
jgi:hypothetical protein